jgi:1-acyl-sn-glycerol-3-phosphate acyltransferase
MPLFECYFDYKLKGTDNLPEGPAILVPNHCMMSDGLFLNQQVFRSKRNKLTHFFVQNGVYDKLKPYFWAKGQIPVRVDKRSPGLAVLKRTKEYIDWTTDYLGIFAEGPTKDLVDKKTHRIVPINEREHSNGAAFTAVKNQVPIVPVGIRSNDFVETETWKYTLSKFWQALWALHKHVWKNGKAPYYINFGNPIYPDKLEDSATRKQEKTAIRDLAQRVREEVIRLAQTARD